MVRVKVTCAKKRAENLIRQPILNRYQVCAADPVDLRDVLQVVTFTCPDIPKFPLPSPCYLRLRDACAQVAHLSGARDYIGTVLEDLEEIRVLAYDGSTADVLDLPVRYRHCSLLNTYINILHFIPQHQLPSLSSQLRFCCPSADNNR
jgi:hypothetical protein